MRGLILELITITVPIDFIEVIRQILRADTVCKRL